MKHKPKRARLLDAVDLGPDIRLRSAAAAGRELRGPTAVLGE